MNATKKRKLIGRPWICVVCRKLYQAGEGYVLHFNGRLVGYHCLECESPRQIIDKDLGIIPVAFFDQEEAIKTAYGGKREK